MFFDKHLGINTEVLHILSANWRCQRERDWLKGKKRRREETKTFRVLRGRSDSRLLIFFPRFSLFFPSEVTVTSSNAIESICRSSHLIHLPSILPSPQFLLSDLRIFLLSSYLLRRNNALILNLLFFPRVNHIYLHRKEHCFIMAPVIDSTVVPGTVTLVDVDHVMETRHLDRGDRDIVLIPTPSNDPDDPLNWSPRRKLLSTACVSM